MRPFFFGLGIFFLRTLSAFAAEGQNQAMDFPEVIVQAARVKQSLTVPSVRQAEQIMNRIPGGADLIPAEDYKKGRASTLQDALGYSPGVYVQPRFGAEEARLSIRGSGLQRTFHLRGIKLLQDGIPINQADGGGDFQSIDPLALQYIEVYRGANALQYGSTTLGGAVNFVTPTGYHAPLAQGRFEAGGFNYLREQFSSGAVAGPLDYYVSLSEFRQDGFRNHSDQWTKRLFSNYGIRFNDHVETRFTVNLTDSKSKLPGNLTLAQMKQNPKQNNPANVTGNQKRDFDSVQLAHKTAFKWESHFAEAGTFLVRKDLFHPIFQVIDQVSHDFGANFRYQNTQEWYDRQNILTLGFHPVWNFVEAAQHVNRGGGRDTLTVKALQRSYNLDLYGEDQFYLLDSLVLAGGLQWSFASRKSTDKFLSDGNHGGHPTYAGLSPKIGVRYEATETCQAFANYSRSFEPPSFGELSNVMGGGIRDLTEQTAHTLEIGTRGEEDRFAWDIAYYYSWVENELLSLNDGSGNPLGTVNAFGTRHQGIEWGGRIALLRKIFSEKNPDRVVLRGIYHWSRFRFSDNPAFRDNPLPGIPEHFIRTELLYEHPAGIYFGPNLEWTPVDYPVDMNNTLFTYPYALLGLKAGYRTRKGLSFFLEAKNLTNEIYAAAAGVIANANGSDSAQFLPGDGRTLVSGIEWHW